MSKLTVAGLLLVTGLTIGLWLGFNPKTHQQILQNWNHATAAVAHVGLAAIPKVHTLQAPAAVAKPLSQPKISTSAAWKQISVAFETLWNSVQHLWHTVTARIRITR